jgi:DMSO/TMAO reductase YedYZ molybdopterin-dependent catalytic subunit
LSANFEPGTLAQRLAIVAAVTVTISVGRFAPLYAQTPASPAVDAAATTLIIGGDVAKPLTLTPAEIKTMPRTTVTVDSEDGRKVSYEGVLVGELLKRAGAPVGRDLTGKAIATYVRASATDGYQVVFSIAELDPAFTANEIIVADTVDGKALPDQQGPLRIVAPHDSHASRWVRMLQRIDVVRLAK